MKITVELSQIDYGALVKLFLPMLRDKLSEHEGMAILSKIAGMPPAMAAKMVNALPQATKDEMAVTLANKNRDKIAQILQRMAAEKGLSFHVDDLKIE